MSNAVHKPKAGKAGAEGLVLCGRHEGGQAEGG